MQGCLATVCQRVLCHLPCPQTSGKVGALAHTGSLHRKELSMPAPLHHQPSPDHPHTFSIGLHDVLTGPPHAGESGESVLLRTDRGDIQALLHPAPAAQHGVIWVGGARGASVDPVRAPMRGSRKRCVRKGLLPCGCATGTPTSCPNVRSISWPGSPLCSRTACSVSSSSGTRLAGPWSLPRARCTSTWRASWR